ncbi:MAG: DNA polymerase III subunit chi [Acetobacteraceae bacterium]|nr:DNA polymerase III subunit chi [Acetobacteraceae bacterium]
MSEIGFYHLTRTSADKALPQLLGRTLKAGHRAVVLCGSAERVEALDLALWLENEPDWLPHGTAAMGEADLQPIWLTALDEAPNGAKYLFLIDGANSARLEAFERVFDLFDGNDERAVQDARQRWKSAKAAGHTLAYWQQGARGWEKMA